MSALYDEKVSIMILTLIQEKILLVHLCIKLYFMTEEHKTPLRQMQTDKLPRIIEDINVCPQRIY